MLPLVQLEADLRAVVVPCGHLSVLPGRDRLETDRQRVVLSQSPLDLVDAVRAPVRHLSADIIAALRSAAPVRTPGALIEMQLPMETRRNRLLLVAVNRRGWPDARVVHGRDVLQLAEPAVAHELAGDPVHLHRALLGSDLEDRLVLANVLNQRPTFLDVQRQWFLCVNIELGAAFARAIQAASP
jgi:hypothetical protein